MIDGNNHHIAFSTQICSIIYPLFNCRTGLKPSAVQPNHYRAFLAVIYSRSPYIQILAILSLDSDSLVRDKIILDGHGSLRTDVSILREDSCAVPRFGSFGRHESGSVCIRNTLINIYSLLFFTLRFASCKIDNSLILGCVLRLLCPCSYHCQKQ